MKMVKKFFLCLVISFTLLVPFQSRAGIIGDFLSAVFGKEKKHDPKPPTSTSVPINGGMFLLMVGGLALGAKLLYDRKAKKDETLVA